MNNIDEIQVLADSMMFPVICNHCNRVYDKARAKVTHRFADCTQFTTPCCNRTADTRKWKSLPDYEDFSIEKMVRADGLMRINY